MLIILLCFVELVFGIMNFENRNVCQEGDFAIRLPIWIISKAVIEMILVLFLLCYNINNSGYIKLYCLYAIFFIYLSSLVIGFSLFCEQCLSGENAFGTVFISICLIDGFILSIINFKVIEFLDHIRYTIHSLDIPLLDRNYHNNNYRGGRV